MCRGQLAKRSEGSRSMKRRGSLLVLMLLGSPGWAQEPLPGTLGSPVPVVVPRDMPGAPLVLESGDSWAGTQTGRLSGNHNFPRFIGFLGNPLQNIDPR